MLFRLDYSIDTKSASRLCYNVGQAPEGGHIGSSSPRRGSFWFQTPEGGDIAVSQKGVHPKHQKGATFSLSPIQTLLE